MEFISGRMEESMKATGLMENKTAKDIILTQMDPKERVFGKKEKE